MPLIEPARLLPLLGEYAGRFDVDALDSLDSTSSELGRRAELGAGSGTVIVADEQTAGRGRRGRTWLSRPEDSLTFSLLWRFKGPFTRLSGLSLAVGVALARALEGFGAEIALKWPNDLLLRRPDTQGGDAKLGGILLELGHDSRGIQAVIGIGLNLRRPDGDLPQPAAGLDEALPMLPERHELFAALLRELAATLDAFTVDGFPGQKMAWQQRHAWQDQPVRLSDDGLQRDGLCLGVDDDGALLLQTGTGIETVLAGDVSLRRR